MLRTGQVVAMLTMINSIIIKNVSTETRTKESKMAISTEEANVEVGKILDSHSKDQEEVKEPMITRTMI